MGVLVRFVELSKFSRFGMVCSFTYIRQEHYINWHYMSHLVANRKNRYSSLASESVTSLRPKPHERQRKFHNFPQHGTFVFEKSSLPCFSP